MISKKGINHGLRQKRFLTILNQSDFNGRFPQVNRQIEVHQFVVYDLLNISRSTLLAKINHKVFQHCDPHVLSMEIPSPYRIGWNAKSTVVG
jgi:hypothetical protein